jgi:phosphoesterase RecJ-like protein
LTGILTDTGGFSNMATTTRSMEIASRLLLHGALIQEVNDNTWKNKSLHGLQLWGRALSRLKRNPKTGIVSTAIFQKDFVECGAPNDAIEGIANFLNSLEDAAAALLLKEMPDGLINGSYRTTAADMDVAKLAGRYGGGGHIRAAGFTTPGRIIETDIGWEISAT